jgi:rhamnosyltransferase subunit B
MAEKRGKNLKRTEIMNHHYILIALGTVGDVHPFIAIGKSLKAMGFQVTLASNGYFQERAEAAGLSFFSLGSAANCLAAIRTMDIWDMRKGLPIVIEQGINPLIRPVYDFISQQDLTKTTILASSLAFGARIAQDKLGAKVISIHLQPFIFWSAERPANLPGMFNLTWLPRSLRHSLLHKLELEMTDQLFGAGVNAFRQELGLPKTNHILSSWIHSPEKIIGLFPEWYAPPAADWPHQVKLTGFINYDGESQEIPSELEEFLNAGEAPVVFTPGTAVSDATEFFQESIKAAKLLGKRALLLSTQMENKIDPNLLDDSIRFSPYIPFSRCLSRASALVHHGGIGTSAQALAAGIPHLVRPFNFDQPDNAVHLRKLGVAEIISSRAYRASKIAKKLDKLLNSKETLQSCTTWSCKMNSSKALAQTCEYLVER